MIPLYFLILRMNNEHTSLKPHKLSFFLFQSHLFFWSILAIILIPFLL